MCSEFSCLNGHVLARSRFLRKLETATGRSPITALLGPRQCGKTTLARTFGQGKKATYFDLESHPDRQRLQNPEFVLGGVEGLVVLDEVQVLPDVFSALRVIVDRPDTACRFLILGSASPHMVKAVSETLAGRVEFIELSGFDLTEVGSTDWEQLWLRGGFPRAFLATSDEDSLAWREGFIRTFLERDIPQLGITIPAAAMRRFWTMLSYSHGQIWNASDLARSLGLSDKTVRSYLDILTGTFMVRQLQPWFENVGKRQVKSPKIYLRDSGLLHSLLGLPDRHTLLGHARLGASWEGFAVEQILRVFEPCEAFFWATHSGAEIDLFLIHKGQRLGFEVKFSEAPTITRSMRIAQQDLRLSQLWVVHPGRHRYSVDQGLTVIPLAELQQITS